jgi:hypothetical protein
MNLKILAATAVAMALIAPTQADAQSRRGYGRPDYGRPSYGRPDYRPNRPRQGRPYDYRPTRIRRYDNSGWPYGYPNDYRWPYVRSYNLGTGRLYTPYGADVYVLPNGVRVYLPR